MALKEDHPSGPFLHSHSPAHPSYIPLFIPIYSLCAVGVSECLALLVRGEALTDPTNSVRNICLRCGHAENLVSPLPVKCSSTHCKFSPNHPAGCVPPSCSTRCSQYHLFPEHYNPNIDGFCSACTRAMGSGRRCY
ncbi:hypothetical protein K438DRAFT_1590309 [Mycena galopus ATCC 62051]|nr:hypothetical protein K438DRAFT_1590309 [Mycena galopus ATCC 62051]